MLNLVLFWNAWLFSDALLFVSFKLERSYFLSLGPLNCLNLVSISHMLMFRLNFDDVETVPFILKLWSSLIFFYYTHKVCWIDIFEFWDFLKKIYYFWIVSRHSDPFTIMGWDIQLQCLMTLTHMKISNPLTSLTVLAFLWMMLSSR